MKAILVIDEMPITCLSCPFPLSHICEVEKITVGEVMDGTITRHESCPLRPLPQKKTTKNPIWADRSYDDFNKGYNACLDELLGENNESNSNM